MESAENEGKVMTKCDNVSEEEKAMHDRLDSLIDVKKPLMPQIETLTNAEFRVFLRRPRFIKDEDGIQIFADQGADNAHKRKFEHNVTLVAILVPVCLYMAFIDSTMDQFKWNVPLYITFGFFIAWTYIEYYFHRFVLHGELTFDDNKKADPKKLAKIFARHGQHHVFMN